MRAGSGKRAAVGLLAAVHLAALAAGFLAPYSPLEQNRTMPYAPPTKVRFVDAEGGFHARPFVYAIEERDGLPGAYVEDRSRRHPVRFLVTGAPYVLAGIVRGRTHLLGVEEPARLFLLGADGLGRDQLSRLLHGAQVSLMAGLLAAALSLGLGWVMGTIAGFYGGWVDAVVMRGAELFLALPWLYLLLAVRAALPLHVPPAEAFLMIVLVIGIVDCGRPARLVRGVVLSARERNYVLAARGFGASDLYLVRRHIAPHTLGLVLTQAAVLVPQYVLAEMTLSFLGLGVSEPAPSWGNMLAALQQYHVLSTYWWMWAPGLALVPVFLAYFVLSERISPAGSSSA
jgi:peptide/nickel transport system permease protein